MKKFSRLLDTLQQVSMKILSGLKTCTFWWIHHFKFQTKFSAVYSKYTLCPLLRTSFKRKLQQTVVSLHFCVYFRTGSNKTLILLDISQHV